MPWMPAPGSPDRQPDRFFPFPEPRADTDESHHSAGRSHLRDPCRFHPAGRCGDPRRGRGLNPGQRGHRRRSGCRCRRDRARIRPRPGHRHPHRARDRGRGRLGGRDRPRAPGPDPGPRHQGPGALRTGRVGDLQRRPLRPGRVPHPRPGRQPGADPDRWHRRVRCLPDRQLRQRQPQFRRPGHAQAGGDRARPGQRPVRLGCARRRGRVRDPRSGRLPGPGQGQPRRAEVRL